MIKKLLFILFLLFSVNAWASFPTTSVLDSFTRANENPLSDGSKWTLYPGIGASNLQIISNQAVDTGSGLAAMYWNPNSFTDSECFVTIASAPTGTDFADCLIRFSATGANGYFIIYSPSNIQIERYDAGSPTSLHTYSQAVSSGDSIGVSAVGTTLTTYYKASGGSWTSLGTVTDSTYASGYIGLAAGGTTYAFTNFGGGTYIPPVSSVTTTINNATIKNATIN